MYTIAMCQCCMQFVYHDVLESQPPETVVQWGFIYIFWDHTIGLRLYNQLGRDYIRHVFSAVLIFLLFDLLVFLMQQCTHMPRCPSFSGVSFHFPCVPTSFSTPGYGSILLFLFCFPTQQR